MKTISLKSLMVIGSVTLTVTLSAQKKNETSAAVEFKNNYQAALMSKDLEKAKNSLIAAKGFIDLAAEHPETKESPKTLYYKGEIYANFMLLGIQLKDSNLIKMAGDNPLETAIASYKKSFEINDKFDDDIKQSINQLHDLTDLSSSYLYKNNNFKEAAEGYQLEVDLLQAIGEVDTISLYNSALCFENAKDYTKAAANYEKVATLGYKGTLCYVYASRSLRKNKQSSEAKAIVSAARSKFPTDKELLLELVNINLESGDAAGAESALSEAISKDPSNKQLHYTIGTIYMDLKQNDKAEQALVKALEIDPNYEDALYQLGAHLVNLAGEIRNAANNLKINDPNYDKMLTESDATYKRAVGPLEKYAEKNPTDKSVLTILFQLHRNLGNMEKATEYKKRADAIK